MMTLPVMREKLASCRALWTGFRSPNLGAGRNSQWMLTGERQ
jgi:hypothetical protein